MLVNRIEQLSVIQRKQKIAAVEVSNWSWQWWSGHTSILGETQLFVSIEIALEKDFISWQNNKTCGYLPKVCQWFTTHSRISRLLKTTQKKGGKSTWHTVVLMRGKLRFILSRAADRPEKRGSRLSQALQETSRAIWVKCLFKIVPKNLAFIATILRAVYWRRCPKR